MKGLINITARLILAGQRAYLKKWSFLFVFAFVFFVSTAILARLELLPTIVTKAEASIPNATNTNAHISTPAVPELPTKIEIPSIDLSAVIANPVTTDVATLDNELLN